MATLFTYTSNGIQFEGFQDIRAALKSEWNSVFGTELDYSETSPDGHHIDLEAKVIDSVAELVKAVVANLNRQTAQGQFLDYLAFFLGLERQADETDSSLLSRMESAVSGGLATFDGMLTYLCDKVSAGVAIAENPESSTSDGIGPHGIRVSVPADYTYNGYAIGTEACNNHVAQMIWNCKPAGIRCYGNQSGTATDGSGRTHGVAFSVPESVAFAVSATITLYSEESFPADGKALIKSAIASYATANFKPGTDVIPQRLFVPMFSIPGIASATILIKKVADTEWSTGTIAVSSEQTATISADDVSVEID